MVTNVKEAVERIANPKFRKCMEDRFKDKILVTGQEWGNGTQQCQQSGQGSKQKQRGGNSTHQKDINKLSLDELIIYVKKHRHLSIRETKEVIIDYINTKLSDKS
jgi:hypothetical protein